MLKMDDRNDYNNTVLIQRYTTIVLKQKIYIAYFKANFGEKRLLSSLKKERNKSL